MIRIKKSFNEFKISGHADYADYGNDIVCASVSSIVTTVINCIMNIDASLITFSDDGYTITILKNKEDKICNTILNTMMELFKDLESKYKENIKIESEE